MSQWTTNTRRSFEAFHHVSDYRHCRRVPSVCLSLQLHIVRPAFLPPVGMPVSCFLRSCCLPLHLAVFCVYCAHLLQILLTFSSCICYQRPYRTHNAGACPVLSVKRISAWLVLGWMLLAVVLRLTRYGLHGPRIESRCGEIFRIIQSSVKWVQCKAPGAWPPPPPHIGPRLKQE